MFNCKFLFFLYPVKNTRSTTIYEDYTRLTEYDSIINNATVQ